MKNYFTIAALLLVVLFANVSAHNSIWPNCNYLSNNDKAICVQFHYLKGSNRIAEFRKIAGIVFKTNDIASEKKYSTMKINLYDMTQILGKPDKKTDNKIVYYLNSASADCRVEIEEDTAANNISCMIYGIN